MGQDNTKKIHILTLAVNACQRFFESVPIKIANAKKTNVNNNENTSKKIPTELGNPVPNKTPIKPATPNPKATIAIMTIKMPIYFPSNQFELESGSDRSSCQFPSSFSDVTEKEPNNNVISGRKYSNKFIIVPVMEVYLPMPT